MKKINSYLTEKLVINKDIKNSELSIDGSRCFATFGFYSMEEIKKIDPEGKVTELIEEWISDMKKDSKDFKVNNLYCTQKTLSLFNIVPNYFKSYKRKSYDKFSEIYWKILSQADNLISSDKIVFGTYENYLICAIADDKNLISQGRSIIIEFKK